MRHISAQQVTDVLNRMQPTFDAHAAEKRALGMYPREVAKEIARHTNGPRMSALQKFSMRFSQYIDREFGADSSHPQIEKTKNGPHLKGKIVSANLAGDDVKNQQWAKTVSMIVAPDASLASSPEELTQEHGV